MPVSDKIKALLKLKGKKSSELAQYLGISSQAMSNKLYRDSFSASDLIKVSAFLDCELAYDAGHNQKIVLNISDLHDNEKEEEKQPLSLD